LKNTEIKLKKSFAGALIALIIAVFAAGAATFAWYIYNTGAHTSTVKMAAGSTSSLLIGKEKDGTFSSSLSLSPETGSLLPVSTDMIRAGFQQVDNFEEMTKGGASVSVAKSFVPTSRDYYKQTFYLRSGGGDLNVYVADIGYTDINIYGVETTDDPISTAIRVGFVFDDSTEAIFAINSKEHITNRLYNTYDKFNESETVQENRVLDSSKTNGETVEFIPLNEDNYCFYDPATGEVSKKTGSKAVCACKGKSTETDKYGPAVKVDMYVWLEGCDPDCTLDVDRKGLKNISVRFSGISE